MAVSTTELVDRIFLFCEAYAYGQSGYHFFPYQAQFSKRIIRSLLENDGEEISALFSRQSGKSEVVSITAGGCAVILPILANMPMFLEDKRMIPYRNGLMIGIFAPALHQAQISFNRLKGYMMTDSAQELFADPEINVVFDTNNGQNIVIRLANLNVSSVITCMSASEGSNIEGKSYMLIIVDEAQDVSNHKYLKCLSEDTEVWLADGSKKKIKEVVDKKLNVLTLDGEKTPKEFYDNGEQEVFQLTLDNGRQIEATSNHQFYVRRRIGNRVPKWDTVSNIKVGDTIATPKQVGYFGEEKKYTKQQGIITGLMLGDGCLCGDSPLFCCLPEVKFYLPYTLKDFDVSYHEYSYNETNGLSEGAIIRDTRKGNKENSLITFFKELGIWGLKGEDKTITPEIFSANKEFLWGVVVGLIESDGCVSTNEISFANISEGMVRGLQDILLKFGVPSRVSMRENNGTFSKNVKPLWVLVIKSYEGIHNFYCTFELGSKQGSLEKLMERVYHKGEKSRNKYTDKRRSKFRDDIYFNRVVSIKSMGVKQTYCLSVEGRNFIANGIVSSNSISPMGAFYNATKVLIGTPTTQKGFFFDAIERNNHDYLQGVRKKNHFQYNYEHVCKYNPNYAKYIEGEKRRLGADSDEFRLSYNLEWLFERGMFVNPEKFEALGFENMHRLISGIGKDYVVGIDCGKKMDSTIVTVGEVNWENPYIIEQSSDPNVPDFVIYDVTIVDWMELQGDNWDEQYYQIISYLRNYRVKKIVIDATGVGSPIADRLAANVDCEVEPYVFSATAKSALYKNYDMYIKQGHFHFPASEQTKETKEYKSFINQHFDLQKSYSGQNMVCAHPDERGAHDDYCLSENMQVLTHRGFVGYKDVTEDDLVAKYDNGKITYVKPDRIIKYEYKGKMIKITSKDIDIEATPEHKLLINKKTSGGAWKKEVIQARDLTLISESTLKNNRRMPVAGMQDVCDYPITDNLIKQIAWFITEGWINYDKKSNTYRYSFAQSKTKPKYGEICKFVEELNLNPYSYTRRDEVTYWTYHVKDNSLFDGVLKEGIHRIPRDWLNNFSYRQLTLLFNTLMDGDGTWGRMTYSTNSIDLAKDFQELCHKIGKKTSIRKCKKGMYNCYIMTDSYANPKEIKEYDYEGIVWCVTVGNGFILVRNGMSNTSKISVVGNCDSSALMCWGARGEVSKPELVEGSPFMFKQSSGFYHSRNRVTARRSR